MTVLKTPMYIYDLRLLINTDTSLDQVLGHSFPTMCKIIANVCMEVCIIKETIQRNRSHIVFDSFVA